MACCFEFVAFRANFNNFMTPHTVALDFLSEVAHSFYIYYDIVEF